MAGKPLEDLLNNDGPEVYYRKDFRDVIEDHLLLLTKAPQTQPLSLEPFLAELNKGNFYGLLIQLKIPKQLHWITLRVNGLTTPSGYTGDTYVLVPDNDYVERLVSSFLTKQKTI